MAYGKGTASDFLPSDRRPSDRQRAVAQLLSRRFSEHRKRPDITPGVAMPRSCIDRGQLSKADLMDAGFVRSVVAVPETGQTSLVTWRHPKNGMHIHQHADKWLFHEDSHPSLSMLMAKYNQDNPDATLYDKAGYFLSDALPRSYKHVVYEGLPGYVNWAAGTIKGSGGMLDSEKTPSKARTLGGIVLVTAALSAAQGLATNEANIAGNAATVGGFLGGHALASSLYDKWKADNPVLRRPGVVPTILLAGLPIASALAARRMANWATTPDRRYEV